MLARHLCAKQGGEPMGALDVQKIKARDVFVAQEVLPNDRHRKLGSIAQGFAGIRARLEEVTQLVPDGEQVVPCAEKAEVSEKRRTTSETAAKVALALDRELEARDQMHERAELPADQTADGDRIPEKQGGRSMHQAIEDSAQSLQRVPIPGLMEAARPFLLMICEEFAKAIVKVISAHGLRATLPVASSQAPSPVVFRREGAVHGPIVEERQLNSRPDNSTGEQRRTDDADVKRVNIDVAPYEDHEECDELDVQPLFDPKLPPSADSDFKPKIGLVSTPGSDFEGLRQRYPQLHLTIVQAEALSDVRRFGHCQRIIALREEISVGTDALLSRLLRHRYIRLDGGMDGVITQLDAWLASPGSITGGSRRRMPFSGIEMNAVSGRKRQNPYSTRIGDAS